MVGMRSLRWCAALVTMLAGTGRMVAAQSTPRSFGCPDPVNHQFDFWVGDWNVTSRGAQAGTNLVTAEEGGCVVHEHWTGARGGTGQSFNFYDTALGKWHQLWVDNQGTFLYLTGAFADDRMVLEGTAPGPDGTPQQQRLTFFRNSDGTVRQLWETSADRGRSWSVAFDGIYVKK
jgi:hypothetical protein